MEYSVVEKATGRILRHGVCQDGLIAHQSRSSDEAVIVGSYTELLWYVRGIDPGMDIGPILDMEGKTVNLRPELPAIVSKTSIVANDTDRAVVSGLPTPCSFTLDGVAHVTTDGTIEISSPMPASYLVEIDQWPFLPWRTSIEAV